MKTWRSQVVTALYLASAAATAVSAGQAGSAEIAGIVVTTGTPPAPLARVLVTLGGAALTSSRATITDDHGRFVFGDLAAGRYTLTAARPPYVRTAFGARRPGRPGTPIALAAAQHLDDVTIALAQGAVISGLVRSPSGEPSSDLNVRAVPVDGQTGLSTASAVTDDRGAYRIYGLTPGTYVVSAAVSAPVTSSFTQASDAQLDAILAKLRGGAPGPPAAAAASAAPVAAPSAAAGGGGAARYTYAPIYYPGSPNPDEAETITLAAGDEHDGVNLDLLLVPTATVQGQVSMPGGAVPAGTQVMLVRQRRSSAAAANGQAPPPNGRAERTPVRELDPAGSFRFPDVLPGRYGVRVATGQDTGNPMWAATEVMINGDDVTDLALVLQPALRFAGRFVFEAHAATPLPDPTKVSLALTDLTGEGTGLPSQVTFGRGGSSGGGGATTGLGAPAAARGIGRPDGTFEIAGIVPGTYGVAAALSDSHWSPRSVVVGGHDVLDVPFQIASGGVADVVATFTDLHTELSGTLQAATGVPAPEYDVVAFSSDRSFWRAPWRRVRSTQPATDGHFVFHDLPSGDYLLAALTDVEPSDLADAVFLDGLVPAAVAVHLGEGETRTQNLRISR